MSRYFKRAVHLLVRLFWTSVLLLVISLAVLVQFGRELFPLLNDYRPLLQEQLSHQLGAEVTLGEIEARWRGLRPRVILHQVGVVGSNGATVFTAERVRLEIALLSTLLDWRLAIRQFHFHQLESTLIQSPEGHWRVQGLPDSAPSDDAYRFDDPIDIFLFGRRIELTDTRLHLRLRNGVESVAEMPSMTLENDAQFHRLVASFTLGQDHQFTRVVVEGHGDPRDSNAFHAAGYVQLNGFPLPKLLAALDLVDTPIADHLTAVDQDAQRASGDLDTQLWFVGTPRQGIHFRGYFVTYGLPVVLGEGMREPEQLAARVHGYWQRDADWHLAFNNLELRWPDLPSEALDVHISGSADQPTVLALEELDLALWHQLLEHSGMLPGALSTVLAELQPRGEVRHARLQWMGAEQGYVQVRARLRAVGVNAWQGAPALDGVAGYLHADARGGQLLLEQKAGLTMDFPGIYHQPLAFTEASGGLRWQIDRERTEVGVSSSPLRVVSDGVDAVGLLNLRLPFGGEETQAEPEMTLMIGARESPAMRHRELVPVILPDTLYRWLGQSIQGGQLSDVGFIYHGTLLPASRLARAVQLSARVEQAELAFAEDWPPLTQAQGRLLLDNQAFQVTDVQGWLLDVPIAAATVALIENPSDQGLALDIRGQSQADSSAVMALLQQSPVGGLMGEELASWDVQGRAQGDVELLIPLHAGASGAHQEVAVQLLDNRLFIPRLNLNFDTISGNIYYSTDRGFRAPGLNARLWEQVVDLDVHTELASEQNHLQVGFAGDLDFAQLPQWLKHDHWAPLISGVAPVSGQLQVPLVAGMPILFQAASELQGVSLELPEPMYKAPGEAWPVAMTIAISPDTDLAPGVEQYRIGLDQRADLRLSMQRGQLQGLTLALGETADAIEPGVIMVQGAVESVNWQPWRATLGQLFPLEGEASDLPEAAPVLPVHLALAIGTLHTGSLTLEDLAVAGERTASGWQLLLNNDMLSGTVAIDADGRAMELALDYLRLPGLEQLMDQADEEEIEAFAFDALEPLDAVIGQLSVGDQDYGHWSFKARPVNDGLVIYDIHGQVSGLTIAGQERGAELLWMKSGDRHHSYFSGVAKATDIGRVLSHWQATPALTSRLAHFNLDLQWPGTPQQVALTELSGQVDVHLERGRFVRGAEVGENPLLKLIGLFNFDTLARRLRLDFSDLNPEGMGYERVAGSMTFQQGAVRISEPLQVDSPSSSIQFLGDIDLREQQIDAQVIATLPLAGNLTVAAALTGGLPIAVGVYVVGKIFKRQVDRASSLRYRVQGPWGEPDVKLERIFDNPASKASAP